MLLVGLMTMGFQMWSWFLGPLMAAYAVAQAADAALKKADAPDWLRKMGTGVYGTYQVWSENKAEEEAEEQAEEQARLSKLQPYRRSEFMPGAGDGGHMARYAPGNRPMQSGVSPNVMDYLRKYVR